MSKTSRTTPKLVLPTIIQETDSHCGPATVQVLLSFLNKSFTQSEIVDAAKVKTTIKKQGTRPDQLARAIATLAPDYQFWFKQRASSSDLETLIHKYRWPVAVNWQGLFYDTVEEEEKKNPNGEHGHYSVAVDIDPEQDKIVISDPYWEYSEKPRVFSLKWFVTRWWDVDHLINRKTKEKDSIYTQRLIFVIAPKDATFPKEINMQLPDKLDILNKEIKGKKYSRFSL